MYHLYPTGFEEHCVPTSETGGDGGAALVDQKATRRHLGPSFRGILRNLGEKNCFWRCNEILFYHYKYI